MKLEDVSPLNFLSIWELVNTVVQIKLKTKYTSSYLELDMIQLENLFWTILLVNIPISILKMLITKLYFSF